MSAAEILKLSNSLLGLHLIASRFARSLSFQFSSTAFANGKFVVRQRLARWLLMIHDRTLDNPLDLTHDAIAFSLGVRRSSVTDMLHILEGETLIKATRSQVKIARGALCSIEALSKNSNTEIYAYDVAMG